MLGSYPLLHAFRFKLPVRTNGLLVGGGASADQRPLSRYMRVNRRESTYIAQVQIHVYAHRTSSSTSARAQSSVSLLAHVYCFLSLSFSFSCVRVWRFDWNKGSVTRPNYVVCDIYTGHDRFPASDLCRERDILRQKSMRVSQSVYYTT